MAELRAIPRAFPTSTVDEIDSLLDAVEIENAVTIPLAIESGSRAWGFPSPDSDFDCRFVYVRRTEAYLTPWMKRDVIEAVLDRDLDVNGWDLGKALKLMLKGNAVIIEWLRSPIVYRGDTQFRDDFLTLAQRWASPILIGRHYLHLGERQRRTYFGDGREVALKKLFYALRPAAALRWLRLHDAATIPPMHFPTLMSECAPPTDVEELVETLLIRKSQSRELGTGPLPPIIAAFVESEFQIASERLNSGHVDRSIAARNEAEEFFRTTVRRFS